MPSAHPEHQPDGVLDNVLFAVRGRVGDGDPELGSSLDVDLVVAHAPADYELALRERLKHFPRDRRGPLEPQELGVLGVLDEFDRVCAYRR